MRRWLLYHGPLVTVNGESQEAMDGKNEAATNAASAAERALNMMGSSSGALQTDLSAASKILRSPTVSVEKMCMLFLRGSFHLFRGLPSVILGIKQHSQRLRR